MFWAVVMEQRWLVADRALPGVEGVVGEEGRERGGRVGLLTFLAGFALTAIALTSLQICLTDYGSV